MLPYRGVLGNGLFVHSNFFHSSFLFPTCNVKPEERSARTGPPCFTLPIREETTQTLTNRSSENVFTKSEQPKTEMHRGNTGHRYDPQQSHMVNGGRRASTYRFICIVKSPVPVKHLNAVINWAIRN